MRILVHGSEPDCAVLRITAVAHGPSASKDGSNVKATAEMISMEGNARDLSYLIRIPVADCGMLLPDHDHALAGTQRERGRWQV